MTAYVALLLALWTACEALGQVLFKRGIDAIDSGEPHFGPRTLWLALASPAIWGGILIHIVEFAVWIEILGHLPLSVAFPMESISYVTVLVATRLFLREAVPPRRWMGIALICTGIAVLGVAP